MPVVEQAVTAKTIAKQNSKKVLPGVIEALSKR